MAQENDDTSMRVVFKMHAEPDVSASEAAGRPIYREVEIIEIAYAGNRSTVFVAPAHSEAGFLTDPDTQMRTRITYAQKYNKQYLQFKSGEAQSLTGTPIEELPFLTQAKRLELKALNIYTAEALAALDGHPLKMLGPGGRDLKNQAQTYIDNAAKNADASHLKSELDKRDEQIAELQAQVASLLRGGVSPNSAPAADPKVASAFDTFEDEDIRNWLKEADPALAIDGRWGRKKLIEMADAILEKQGKKKAA